MTAAEIDDAATRLKHVEDDLRSAHRSGMTESDTRLRVINRLLTEVLGWRHEAIFAEPHTQSGYIDYLLKEGGTRSVFVIEAKKTGVLVPATASNDVAFLSLDGPVIKPLKEAVSQALRYANDEGVPVAAITDGMCWLFFRASRTDGKKPLEGKGILFPNFDSVVTDFPRFYELLSPTAIADRRNLIHLNKAEGLVTAHAEQHFFAADPKVAKMLARHPLSADAARIFSEFFSKLSDEKDEEMLRECFVETQESKKADTELSKIAEQLINSITKLETHESIALQDEVERALISRRSETVLLIGNKGSGKSTFMKRFFKYVLRPNLRSKCIVCRVDLEKYLGSTEDISRWTLNELKIELEAQVFTSNPATYEELRGVFWKEYNRWKDGPYKPLYEKDKEAFKIEFGRHIELLRQDEPDTYVRSLLQRSVDQNNKVPCIVFDNTDQFSLAIQDRVYQFAHAISSDTTVFSIVPITDRSVWRLSKAGALQSYSAKSFYLPVPEAKEIIKKRVGFLKGKLEGRTPTARAYFSSKGFQVGLKDISIIADAVERVFVGQDYISGLIGRLGNFDIRRMLELAEKIFLSPEIKIDDVLKSRFGGRAVTGDLFRTHRAIIKGEYDRYSESKNVFVTNLFSTDPLHPTSPLISYYSLALLKGRASASADDRQWGVHDLCNYFESCGVPQDVVLKTLQKLHARGLIEELDPNTETLALDHRISIKEAGIAHLDLALTSSTYLEQMALSTGLIEPLIVSKLRELMRTGNAQNFISIRNVFITYLLRIDASRLTIPTNPDFRPLQDARNRIREVASTEPRHVWA